VREVLRETWLSMIDEDTSSGHLANIGLLACLEIPGSATQLLHFLPTELDVGMLIFHGISHLI
jgi:hypothetical protein